MLQCIHTFLNTCICYLLSVYVYLFIYIYCLLVCVRVPADELDGAMSAVSCTNGTVPSDTLGTVASNDTVLCSAEMEMSSQSVEIITNEESNLLELDLRTTSPPPRDLDPEVEGQFVTAKFYIGEEESLPESPASQSAVAASGKVGH